MSGFRRHPVLSVVAGAYLVGFAVYGSAIGAAATVPYVVLIVAAAAVLAVADRVVGFSRPVLVGLAAWGALHLAGGVIPVGDGVLYEQHLAGLRFDLIVHAIGFGFGALATWEVVRRWLRADAPRGAGAAVVVTLLGMGLGGLNEAIEFGATLLLPETNVGGYVNTGQDLVADLVGSLAAAAWVVVRERGRPTQLLGGTTARAA